MMKITHIRTPLHDTSVIRACLVLPLGSAFDPSDKAGLTHVLEHCLYAQAVQAWQNGQKQYVLEFFTATTFRDHIEFDIIVSVGDEGCIDELLANLTMPLKITEDAFRRELETLHRELIEQESHPDYAHEQAEAQWLYPETIKKPNGGTSASIRNIELADVVEWHSTLSDSEILLITTENYYSKMPLKEAQSWRNSHPVAFEHVAGPANLKLDRSYGEDAIIHVFLMAQVANESHNNYLLLLCALLDNQLRMQAEASGDMYYFGTDTFTVGAQTELSLTVTVAPEKVSYYQAFLRDVLEKAGDISETDFIDLRDKLAKTQSITQSDPAVRFANYCFSAIAWGQSWHEYHEAEKSLARVELAEFLKFLERHIGDPETVKIAQIVPAKA